MTRDPRHAPDEQLARARHAPLDLLGAAASCVCACHCVALPAAVALLPALGLRPFHDEHVEWALLAFTAVVGALSLGPAAVRASPVAGRRWHGLALLATGLALLLGTRMREAQIGETFAAGLTLAGAGLIAIAHLSNGRRATMSGCCPCPGSDRVDDTPGRP